MVAYGDAAILARTEVRVSAAADLGQAYAAVIGDLERRAADAFAEGARLEAAIEALRALSGARPSAAAIALPAPAPQMSAVSPRPSIQANGRPQQVTDEQVRWAVAEGLSDVQAAGRIGCSPPAVWQRRKKLGLVGPGRAQIAAAQISASASPPGQSPAQAVEAVTRPAWFDEALNEAMPVMRQRALSLTRGNAAEAQDVLQDATVRAMRSWHTFAPGTNFAGWMYTILRNAFLSAKRTAASRGGPAVALDDAPPVAVSGGQEAAVELGETLDALDALPEAQRDAVIGAAIGQTLDETAADAGVPVGTIKSRVSRGREALRGTAPADEREEIERFIREKGVTKCPPSSTMRGAQIAAAVEEMARRKSPFRALANGKGE